MKIRIVSYKDQHEEVYSRQEKFLIAQKRFQFRQNSGLTFTVHAFELLLQSLNIGKCAPVIDAEKSRCTSVRKNERFCLISVRPFSTDDTDFPICQFIFNVEYKFIPHIFNGRIHNKQIIGMVYSIFYQTENAARHTLRLPYAYLAFSQQQCR